MKFIESQIVWNINPNQVEVGPWSDETKWTRKYIFTDGGCHNNNVIPLEDPVLEVFRIFHKLAVAYKLDPFLVHHALLAIDEYRENCLPGTPGLNEYEDC